MLASDFADYAALPLRTVNAGLKLLETSGLLTWNSDETCWVVTRWDERQYESDTSSIRTNAWRDRQLKQDCDVTSTVTVTPPDTDTETDTDTEVSKGLPPVTDSSHGVSSPEGIALLKTHYLAEYAKTHAGSTPSPSWPDKLTRQLREHALIPMADMRLIVGYMGRDGKDPRHLALVVGDFYAERQAGAV